MDVSISIECEQWASLGDVETAVRQAAGAALDAADVNGRDMELSVMLADDDTVAELNQTWRGKAGATNVLSFPVAGGTVRAQDEPPFIGDIAMAFGTVSREACDLGKPLATHLSHLVVHGVLHLMGYDHQDEESAERMQAIETAALALIGLPDPYREYERTAIAG